MINRNRDFLFLLLISGAPGTALNFCLFLPLEVPVFADFPVNSSSSSSVKIVTFLLRGDGLDANFFLMSICRQCKPLSFGEIIWSNSLCKFLAFLAFFTLVAVVGELRGCICFVTRRIVKFGLVFHRLQRDAEQRFFQPFAFLLQIIFLFRSSGTLRTYFFFSSFFAVALLHWIKLNNLIYLCSVHPMHSELQPFCGSSAFFLFWCFNLYFLCRSIQFLCFRSFPNIKLCILGCIGLPE